MTTTIKIPREEIIIALRERDGTTCQHPDCGHELDFSLIEGPLLVTIDHWQPQAKAREAGWTEDEIWDLSNLKLMHRKCNAKKGDLIPNDDGTLPEKPMSRFRFRRQKRAGRPELCQECDNGHNLAPDEICANCGCDAQRYPRWAKVPAPDCDHELFWCWACSIGIIERPSSIATAMRQGDSTEIGEMFDPEA